MSENIKRTDSNIRELKEEPKKKVDLSELSSTKLTEIKDGRVEKKEYSATITTDFYGNVDVFYLNQKDPDFAYRFLRAEDKNLSMKTGDILSQKGGWQVCPKEHLLRIKIPEDRLAPDGFYRKGDTVLAFMPKELYEMKLELKRRNAEAPMEAIRRTLKKGDASLKGVGHPSFEGLQTAEQLKMK